MKVISIRVPRGLHVHVSGLLLSLHVMIDVARGLLVTFIQGCFPTQRVHEASAESEELHGGLYGEDAGCSGW